MGYIYLIRNEVNGKCYIGQTVRDPDRRVSAHMLGHGSVLLKNAIEKYGRDAFSSKILHTAFDFVLDELEREMIVKYNTLSPNGYNLETGGNKNKYFSDDAKKKVSEGRKGIKNSVRRKGMKHTAETKKKISEALKGRKGTKYKGTKHGRPKGMKHTAETRKKIAEGRKGKKHTAETRKKIAETLKGKRTSAETRKKIAEGVKRRIAADKIK